MHRTRKVDSNQAELVKQIRKIPGVSVLHIHVVGKGAPDVIIGYKGKNFLAEIKDPGKFKSQRKLTEDEEKFRNSWCGQVQTVETFDDVIRILKLSELRNYC